MTPPLNIGPLLDAVAEYLDEGRSELIAFAETLLGYDTQKPPGRIVGMADWLEATLSEAGIDVERIAVDPEKPNLLASIPGTTSTNRCSGAVRPSGETPRAPAIRVSRGPSSDSGPRLPTEPTSTPPATRSAGTPPRTRWFPTRSLRPQTPDLRTMGSHSDDRRIDALRPIGCSTPPGLRDRPLYSRGSC